MKPINVLQFICPAGMFGAEMWLLALAKHLSSERVDCQLAITHESPTQNIEIFHRFRDLGLGAHKFTTNGRFDPRGIMRLVRLIRELNIDIIHSHGYKSDIIGLIAARLAGIRSLATPHGFENVNDFKLQAFIKLGCFALRFFDCISPLSKELQMDMKRIGVSNHRISIIQNGVDLSEIEAERKIVEPEEIEKDGPISIGYVGQLSHRKNIDAMLNAFDLLHRKHPNTQLILVGEGPLSEDLKNRAKALASGENIEFMGYRKDRLSIVRNLDIFCMTSSLEGIPRCMMEAMGLEVPVAAFDIPGVDQLIINGKTGLLAPFGDVEALVSCWEHLLTDEEYGKRIATAGRQHILDHFSAQRMAGEYEQLYDRLMNSRKR